MMRTPFRSLASTIAILSVVACGPTNPPNDARVDAPLADTSTDDRVDVATPIDTVDVATATDVVDGSVDSRADVPVPIDVNDDADVVDAADVNDAASDAGADVPVDSGGFTLPASCTATAECGPLAHCDTSISRCICNAGDLPCGEACCPSRRVLDITVATGGHIPEIGGDAAGNRYVLFKVGGTGVRLATIDPSGGVSVQSVTSSSGVEDDADMAVAPDGHIYIAVHTDVGSRDGAFTLFERAPGATMFTTRNLRPTGSTPFAYDAAVSIARATNGDLYAAVSRRSGDGTQGLAITKYDNATATWSTLPDVLTFLGYERSEMFARTDGFFLRTHDTNYHEYFYDFGPDAAYRSLITGDSGTVYLHGATAAAMTDAGRLWMYSIDRIDTSDSSVTEPFTFPITLAGLRSDIDMATDADGNPAMLFHSISNHIIGFMVRMPHGGWTQQMLFESSYLPAGTSSDYMTLDLERLPSGNLAIAIGDSMDRGILGYREIAR